jgi:hypothetical protein
VDDKGRTYDTDSELWEYLPPGRDVFLEAVNPGLTEEGQAIYEVPDDAVGLQAEVTDPASFAGDTRRVNLGL